jgi:Flp pilus assembly protein TadG
MIAMRKPSLVSCVNGTTAVEFAMVLPPFLMLLLGTISASLAVYTEASLQYAVEGAARCYSADTSPYNTATQRVSATTTQSYAKSLYHGPSSPTRLPPLRADIKSMQRSKMLCPAHIWRHST